MRDLKLWLSGFLGGALLVVAPIALTAAATDKGMDNTLLSLLIVQTFMFVTLVAGFVHQNYVKKTERKWAEETAARLEEKADKERIAVALAVRDAAAKAIEDARNAAATVQMELAKNATALAKEVTDTAKTLASKVEQGTERTVTGSDRAYTESNHANKKIAELQESLVQVGQSLVALHQHVERTETNTSRAATAAEEARQLYDKVGSMVAKHLEAGRTT